MKLKLKGSEAAAGTSTTNGGNVGLATLVRVHNAGTTERLVTLETVANVTIGTFTIAGGATEYLDKTSTDEIFAANAEVKLVGIAYYS
jgi:ActR/RegA family two-component response regulator